MKWAVWTNISSRVYADSLTNSKLCSEGSDKHLTLRAPHPESLCFAHFPICSHFSDVYRLMNVNDLKAQVVNSHLMLVVAVVVSLVCVSLKALDAVRRGDPDTFGKIWEVHVVLSCLRARDDWQKTVSPLDFLWDVGGSDLTGGTGGLGCAFQKDHQLKVLLGESISRHLVERAWSIDYMVESQGANEKQVIFASIHQKVYVHLVQNDGLSICCGCCPEQLAIDLAAY